MLRISHCLDSQLTDGGNVVSLAHQPNFTSQKLFFFLFSIVIYFRTSGGEYSITDDGGVRPKHVLIGFKK
jgi:hypothetical protein